MDFRKHQQKMCFLQVGCLKPLMRLSFCVSRYAPSKLSVTNGKGRPSVVDFFHFLGFTVLMVVVGAWWGMNR